MTHYKPQIAALINISFHHHQPPFYFNCVYSKECDLIRTFLKRFGWSLPRATPKSANPSNRHRPQRLLQPQLRPSHRPTPHSCIHSLDVSTPFNWLPKSNLLLPSHRLALLALLLHHLIIKLCSDYAENFKERRQTFLL